MRVGHRDGSPCEDRVAGVDGGGSLAAQGPRGGCSLGSLPNARLRATDLGHVSRGRRVGGCARGRGAEMPARPAAPASPGNPGQLHATHNSDTVPSSGNLAALWGHRRAAGTGWEETCPPAGSAGLR